MRKQFIQGLLTGVMAVLVGAAALTLLVMKLGAVRVNADKQPPVLEARLLGLALHASVARHAENRPNPLPTTEENLVAGAEVYAQMCAKRHGQTNAGPSIYGASFYPRLLNLQLIRLNIPKLNSSGSSSTGFGIPPCPPGADSFLMRTSGRWSHS